MSGRFKTVTVGSQTFFLPLQGAGSPWGEELSDLIDAMVDALAIVQGPSDITETSSIILNTSGAKDIAGLAFSTSTVRSAEITYNLSRTITKAISAIPTGTGVIQIDCSDLHNLFTGDSITISGTNSTPAIDAVYTVTYVDANSFSINIGATVVSVAGTAGAFNVELVESGTLNINYGQQGWQVVRMTNGDALVSIDFTASGQAQYNPTVLEGTVHSGLIKFVAKALLDS